MNQITILRQPRVHRFALDGFIALGGSAFLALLSQWALPLPFALAPVTLQTLGICLLGGFLGSRAAFLSVLAYLIEGSLGLPVFAGGLSHPLWLLDLSTGYRLAFLPGAWIAGILLEGRTRPSFPRIALACSGSTLAVLLIGTGWMVPSLGMSQAALLGFLPFLSGSIIKVFLATLILKSAQLARS